MAYSGKDRSASRAINVTARSNADKESRSSVSWWGMCASSSFGGTTSSSGKQARNTRQNKPDNTKHAGAAVRLQPPGTAHVKFKPVVGIDEVTRGGFSHTVKVQHHCISFMKEYESKSLEQLRLEDYAAGRKGNPTCPKSTSMPAEDGATTNKTRGTVTFLETNDAGRQQGHFLARQRDTEGQIVPGPSAAFLPTTPTAPPFSFEPNLRDQSCGSSATDEYSPTPSMSDYRRMPREANKCSGHIESGPSAAFLPTAPPFSFGNNLRNQSRGSSVNGEYSPTPSMANYRRMPREANNGSGGRYLFEGNFDAATFYGLTSGHSLGTDMSNITDEDMCFNLATFLQMLVKTGLSQRTKQRARYDFPIPEDSVLNGPILNPEIANVVTDDVREKDKIIQERQNHIGHVMVAICTAIRRVLEQQTSMSIRAMINACMMLADLHYNETHARLNLISFLFRDSVTIALNNMESDETLTENDLHERVDTSKYAKKNINREVNDACFIETAFPTRDTDESEIEAAVKTRAEVYSIRTNNVPAQETAVSSQRAAISNFKGTSLHDVEYESSQASETNQLLQCLIQELRSDMASIKSDLQCQIKVLSEKIENQFTIPQKQMEIKSLEDDISEKQSLEHVYVNNDIQTEKNEYADNNNYAEISNIKSKNDDDEHKNNLQSWEIKYKNNLREEKMYNSPIEAIAEKIYNADYTDNEPAVKDNGAENSNNETADKMNDQRNMDHILPRKSFTAFHLVVHLPSEDGTDLEVIDSIKKINTDGLFWGVAKSLNDGLSNRKIQISCIIEDAKVSFNWLNEKIFNVTNVNYAEVFVTNKLQ